MVFGSLLAPSSLTRSIASPPFLPFSLPLHAEDRSLKDPSYWPARVQLPLGPRIGTRYSSRRHTSVLSKTVPDDATSTVACQRPEYVGHTMVRCRFITCAQEILWRRPFSRSVR